MQLKTDEMIAEVRGGIGWMTFNNPGQRNAITIAIARPRGRNRHPGGLVPLAVCARGEGAPCASNHYDVQAASAAARSSSASSASSSAGLIAFSHSGRSSVSVATPSATS